ncbi:receptor-like cytosolic serine/threonine-protein kinase RBK2 isoform X1 [Momordica charantia]|uniref:non-specific serine/threonine protein kinase n=2 Tax=Momordica charantia TaxID=3673 RepID=A0A6J1DBQ6_MOMCH|nr:receptor-like cytosolic serine/threonine-protein kinase RBK2 isoform X1 [Momordica charantia]
MENDTFRKPPAPWENDRRMGEVAKRPPLYMATYGKQKMRSNMFPSASARELRCFDLEIEKHDASSPRGVLEASLQSSEFDPDPSNDGNPESETQHSHSRALSHWKKFFKLWKKRSFRRLASFPPLGVLKISRRVARSGRDNPGLSDLYKFKSSLGNFTFSELQAATNKFSHENLIGKGGYAEVYKGRLQDGQLIAVKRLTKGAPDERTVCFLSELGIIAHIDHPNTAKLIGCGIDGGMHLVFKLSQNGSLGSFLHGPNASKLDWSKRYKIALGIADGLLYLHDNCQRRIIHRDIKADNVLLTEDFEPQICDFGLAKWLPKQWTHYSVSKFEGTFGYFAPEYFMHGIVDEKTDVYSFGVLLLELITGRRALDELRQSLVLWAKPLLDSNNHDELIDPSLGKTYDLEEMERVILTASLCIEQSPILRPRMSQVIILLRGDKYVAECEKKSTRASLQRTYSEELLDAQEYNKTRYLSDLKRHRQLAFDS